MPLGTYPYKSQKKAEAKKDISFSFSSVTFTPGEYLYADKDGIITTKENIIL